MSDEEKNETKRKEEWERRSREYRELKEAERIRAEHERQRTIAQRLGKIVDASAKEILEEEQKIQSIARQYIDEEDQESDKLFAKQKKREKQKQKHQERIAKRKAKQVEKEKKQVLKARQMMQRREMQRHLVRLVPVFFFFTVVTLLSAYFISPYSKVKEFPIEGNDHQEAAVLLSATEIEADDYTLTVLQNRKRYEQEIKKKSPWVRTVNMGYRFPSTFPVYIEEYAIVAYQKEKDVFYPILANGIKAEESFSESQVPKDIIQIEIKDEKLISVLVEQLLQLDQDTRESIVSIQSSPTKASSDLVTIMIRDGNKVLIPLSELSRKMVYYPSVTKNITEPTTIDMEAGVFSFPTVNEENQEEKQDEKEEETIAAVTQN